MSEQREPLDGKVAIVTGASRGLGACFARHLAAEGAHVFVNYRTRERKAREVVADIEDAGGKAAALPFDVRDAAAARDAVARVAEEQGRIDILVNNAGLVADTFFAMMEDTRWRDVIETNLQGTYNCTQAVVPYMMTQRSGAIVNVSSPAALRGSPGQSNYAAAKGAIVSLTGTLASELAPKGIRVNCVVPGLIATGMTSRMNREIAEQQKKRIPMGRFGTPEEVAPAVAFLASDKALYVTGSTWVIDGGLLG